MSELRLVERFTSPTARGEVFCGDAYDFLKSIKSRSAAVVFLDPPFNLGKIYSPSAPICDRRPETEYHKWLTSIIRQSVRILAPGGALYLYHLPVWGVRLGALLNDKLTFRHWIAVSMKNGFVRRDRLYPAHYGLLYYTKGDPAVFNRPKLKPKVCRHCQKFIKDYGGYRPIIEEKGINLSDVWDDLSPVRHANTKTRDANQLPPILTDRIMQISGITGGLLVDPFVGSGTSIVSALRVGMHFKACDIVEENCNLVTRSIANQFQEGETANAANG